MVELGDYLKEPGYAALFAAVVVAAYIHVWNRLNNESELKTSDYTKPALLVGLLTWFIVAYGIGGRETISNEPF